MKKRRGIFEVVGPRDEEDVDPVGVLHLEGHVKMGIGMHGEQAVHPRVRGAHRIHVVSRREVRLNGALGTGEKAFAHELAALPIRRQATFKVLTPSVARWPTVLYCQVGRRVGGGAFASGDHDRLPILPAGQFDASLRDFHFGAHACHRERELGS